MNKPEPWSIERIIDECNRLESYGYDMSLEKYKQWLRNSLRDVASREDINQAIETYLQGERNLM